MTYLTGTPTLRLDPALCNGCGKCIEVCPRAVFDWNEKKAAVRDLNACMECGACALNCEARALAVQSGVGCAAAVIRGMRTGGEPTCGCGDENPGAGSACC